jgi:hypothetical protein
LNGGWFNVLFHHIWVLPTWKNIFNISS